MAIDPPDRARKLAAMAQAPGPEGVVARERLQILASSHPELAWLLAPGALQPDEIVVDAPTWLHVRLLQQLAERLDCIVDGQSPELTLCGLRGAIGTVMAHYDRYADPLSAAMDVAGRALLSHCVLPPDVAAPLEEGTPGDLDGLIPELQRLIARHERFARVLAPVPADALRATSERLAALLAPAFQTPKVTLSGVSRAWDDQALTYPEFVIVHRAHFPASTLLEYELRYLYRDGKRLYPPTRRYRLCPELARDESWDAWNENGTD